MDRHLFPTFDYNLDLTLDSGQAFRWEKTSDGWEGIVGRRWVRLQSVPHGIVAETMENPGDWIWLRDYLQLDVDLAQIQSSFPVDPHMQQAMLACKGLRLLRQDPWECLASFILSSTKQIVQIKQIVANLCNCFGDRLVSPKGAKVWNSFPSVDCIARASEADLRGCKMGFRAPNLKKAAEMIDRGEVDLAGVGAMDEDDARETLVRLPGVGPKIANCVLLFAYGFPQAFPVDVWIARGLQNLYFPRRRKKIPVLIKFARKYFGPNSGYAQQYLFQYVRTGGRGRKAAQPIENDTKMSGLTSAAEIP